MTQAYRDQFWHFINVTPSGASKDYKLEGTGVEALSISFNPQVETYKTINQRNGQATFSSYQMQSSVSGKRVYVGDPIYDFLNDARKNLKAIETQLLEVDTAEAGGASGSYVALEYNVLIVINEFLGENATISYDIYYQDVTLGTATMTAGKPTFTKAA